MSDDDVVLTNDQMKALDLVLKGDRNLFITGGAGSGKSTLIRAIVDFSRKRGKNVLVCAPTGVAAMNIDGGMTIHAAFGFPADSCIQDTGEKGLQLKVKSPRILKNADIVLIDLSAQKFYPHKHLQSFGNRNASLMFMRIIFSCNIVLFGV